MLLKRPQNRPIRICGMVKMKGARREALWVWNESGSISLQIVESSQEFEQ
jgi:hypothetical protein